MRRWLLSLLRVPPEPTDPLGSTGTLLVFRASERYYRYRIALWWLLRVVWLLVTAYVFGMIFFVAIAIASSPAPKKTPLFERLPPGLLQQIALVVGGVALVWYLAHSLISWALLRLDWELRWYKVTDRSLRIREGIWFVREMTMSFANIQNISIVQGPIQKLFGVSDLLVQSAGGSSAPGERSSHVGYFRGIEEADKVKALILGRLRKHKDTGLGDHDEPEREARLSRQVDTLAALREVRDEARRLRETVTVTGRRSGGA